MEIPQKTNTNLMLDLVQRHMLTDLSFTLGSLASTCPPGPAPQGLPTFPAPSHSCLWLSEQGLWVKKIEIGSPHLCVWPHRDTRAMTPGV